MKLFILTQNRYYDFTKPDMVNTMIIRAESEQHARELAEKSELENRDGAQKWDKNNSSCEELLCDGAAKIILTS